MAERLLAVQVLIVQGGIDRLCGHVLPNSRCASFLANLAHVLVCALLRHHEAPDQAHDQVPLHPLFIGEEGETFASVVIAMLQCVLS